MKILAFEFSSPHRSVVIAENLAAANDAVARENFSSTTRVLASRTNSGTRSIPALEMVEDTLREAAIEREEIGVIAVGLGPGSNMGIRIAIALAQGWQLACGVRLLGISSADCLAAQAHAAGLRGRVAVAIDAQRGEIYFAPYELTRDSWRAESPMRIVTPEELRAPENVAFTLIGPDVSRWFSRGILLNPDAATVARLAASRSDFVDGAQLEPVYLRLPNFVKAPPSRVIPELS